MNDYTLDNGGFHFMFRRNVSGDLVGSLLVRDIVNGDIAALCGELVGNQGA